MTLDDLERLKRHSCRKKNKIYEPTRKISTKNEYIVGSKMQAYDCSFYKYKLGVYADNSREFIGEVTSNTIHVTCVHAA